MKRTLPLLAVLAATLAAPVAAQDISSILNPGNFAARLGNGAPAMANMPRDMSAIFQGTNTAARLNQGAAAAQIVALAPAVQVETSRLAPRTSLTPVPRGGIARILAPRVEAAPAAAAAVVAAPRGTDLVTAMAEVAEAAPAGANTLVINGSNTAVIQSSPSPVATPSRSLWQRLFGG